MFVFLSFAAKSVEYENQTFKMSHHCSPADETEVSLGARSNLRVSLGACGGPLDCENAGLRLSLLVHWNVFSFLHVWTQSRQVEVRTTLR